MKSEKKLIKLIIAIILIIISIIIFYISTKKSNIQEHNYVYNSELESDYKVYILNNEFIKTPYIEKNNLYISDIVDYINIKFNLNFNASQLKNINYKYDIMLTLYIDYTNNQNLVTLKYPIIENKFLELNNENKFYIEEELNINYKQYNNEVLKFKEIFNLTIFAYMPVEFIFKINIDLGDTE